MGKAGRKDVVFFLSFFLVAFLLLTQINIWVFRGIGLGVTKKTTLSDVPPKVQVTKVM